MIPRERLQKALEKVFGLEQFRPGQLEIISSVINGFDTLAVMPTGGGKSVCYQLPAILSDGLTIVVTPLVSLMKDQVLQINRKTSADRNGAVATQLDSSLDLDEIRNRLSLAKSGRLKLLYVAPERLENRRFVETISQTKITMIAVDEAHCISQWGHDFRPHYTQISDFAAAVGSPVILALTATATPDVQDDIVAQLKMRSPRVYIRGFSRENLSFNVFIETPKTRSLLDYVDKHEGSGIIYAATRKSVDEIHELLGSKGIATLRYHAGLTDDERTRSQQDFLKSDHVMVATNAFGMGINKADVRYIVHYEIPGTLEAYYQEAGRAGRDGKPAECILMFHKKDLAVHEFFIRTLYPTHEEFVTVYRSIFDKLSIAVGVMPDDYLTVSTQEIARLTKLNTRTIDSVLRTLAQKSLIQLMPSISASAYVRAKVDMGAYRRAIEKTASHDSKAVLEAVLRIHGNAIFSEAKPVRIDEIGRKAGIGPSNVIRTLSILHRSGILEYKPPSEGITFRMLAKRQDAERLPIDFQQIDLLRQRAIERLTRVVEYARTTGCRMNYILEYFGADGIEGGCGNCDNCTNTSTYASPENEAGSVLSQKEIHATILSLVKYAGGKYGRTTYCKTLLGSIDRQKIDRSLIERHFGTLKDTPPQAVYSAFDLLLARKYLKRIGLVYPTVSITKEGETYLRTGIPPAVQKPFVLRKALYKALRDERRELASELRVPVFSICTDDRLVEMANEHPTEDDAITAFLPQDGLNAGVIRSRMLQVCRDFSVDVPVELTAEERNLYELFREKLTAVEIAAAQSMTVQGVIDSLEHVAAKGIEMDLRALIDSRKYALLEADLRKTGNVVETHGNVAECELAEVALVARLTGVSV